MRAEAPSALDSLAEEIAELVGRPRNGLQVAVGQSEKSYTVQVLGVMRASRYLITTAPTNSDNALIAVTKGQRLLCSWFNPTTIFRFQATLLKVAFEPMPLMYLGLPESVEHRAVRSVPRVIASLHATVSTPEPVPVLVVDMSLTGARLAVQGPAMLSPEQAIVLRLRLKILDREHELSLLCTVMTPARRGGKHADIHYYGVSFHGVSHEDQVLIHCYVQERLALESDWLTPLLVSEAKVEPCVEKARGPADGPAAV